MIIISQDKTLIMNFSNVCFIATEIEGTVITARINDKATIILGEYVTEERAKEVLKEIAEAYVDSKKSKDAQAIFGYSVIPSNTYYEMPKE